MRKEITISETLAALLGAIIGGLLSMVGAAYAEQRVLARNMRVRMYDEILPELRAQLVAVPPSPSEQTAASLNDVEAQVHLLYRTATVLGSADQTYIKRMQELLDQIRQKHREYHAVLSRQPQRPDISPIEYDLRNMARWSPEGTPPSQAALDVGRKEASYNAELQQHQQWLAYWDDEYKKAIAALSQQLDIVSAYLAEKIGSNGLARILFIR